MAAPAYASDLTDVVVPPHNDGDWGAFGGGASALNTETDYYIIDSDSVSKNAWASDYKGMMYDNTTDLTIPTGEALFVWLTHQTANSLDTEAGGGLRVNMADANTEGTFDSWYVGGSDTVLYDDRWLCAVVDPDETPDLNQSATQDYSWFGAGADLPSGGPTKGAPFAIGAIRYGREFQCTDGDLGNGYATFDGAATYNDASTRRFGQFQLSKGTYSMQGLFVMGTSTTAVDFRDSDRVIFVTRTPKVGALFNGFEIRNASSRVDWTNITIQALGTQSPGYFEMIDSADVNMVGCTFTGMGDFTFRSAGEALGCTWRNCGQIIAPGIDLTGSTVEGYAGTADDSALVWNVAANPDGHLDGMTFTDGSGNNTHAIEFGTSAPTAMTLVDMTFNDYGADSTNNSALNFLRTTGTTTVTLEGTTQPTYQVTGSHTVNFVTNAVDVSIQSSEADGTGVQTNVYLAATSGTAVPVEESVTTSYGGSIGVATIASGHNVVIGDKIVIKGQTNFTSENTVHTVTGVTATTITWASTTVGAGTGTITLTFVFLYGSTNGSGFITMSRSLPSDVGVSGWARAGTTSTYYKQGVVTGTVDSDTGAAFTAVMIPDE